MASRRSKEQEVAPEWQQVGEEVIPGMRLRCICRGHKGPIGRIAWSPSGRFLASPSFDGTVTIWNPKAGKPVTKFRDPQREFYCVAWSPDEQEIAIGSNGPLVHIRGRANGVILRSINTGFRQIDSLSWSPDGANLAIGSSQQYLTIRNAKSGERVSKFGTLREIVEKQIGVLNWSKDSQTLAVGTGTASWVVLLNSNLRVHEYFEGHDSPIVSVAWIDDTKLLSASYDKTLRVWCTSPKEQIAVLEGHTGRVISASTSADGKLAASKSQDQTVRIWRLDSCETIATLSESMRESTPRGWYFQAEIAFHPTEPVLATLGPGDENLRIWDIDVDVLLRAERRQEIVRYTSAKIVLVGESNAGKSCLAMRLAEDRYPEDDEHGTTHGMRFWPMEAEKLHPSAVAPPGQRRDVVLWDMGGQDEYRLVHQLFLHDTTLALVLIDPTRGRAAFDEARDWNKRLEKHLGERKSVKLLVGAKQDRRSKLVDRAAIDELCRECGFADYVEVSAKTGRNAAGLRKAVADALNWGRLAKTSRPELFQQIRDDIERRRSGGEVVLLLDDLKRAIKEGHPDTYEEAAAKAVAEQLATQGVIALTKLTGGEEALVLQLPVIERYAGSLIIAARDNPRRVPALEERLLGSPTLPLPGIRKAERLGRIQERVVLECVAELMIQHGICFRHEGLLVFPTLFPESGPEGGEKIPHSVSLFYDFTGAIDNIYASLVARLMISQEFGEGRLWPNRVEFDQRGVGLCGIRQVKRTGGLAHVDLFFAEETGQERRNLFTRFIEDHLKHHGVEIREHQAIKCRGCDRAIDEDIVQVNIAAGEKDVVCPWCRTHTLISEGVAKIRERDPKSDQKIYALRKEVEERTAKDAQRAKEAVARGAAIADGPAASRGEPIRVLHLSDLHFTAATQVRAKLRWLLQDLRGGDFLTSATIEYLVISGDMTDKGSEEGLDKARQFVSLLIDELKLSPLRCVFVPGNHDVQDLNTSYSWSSSVRGLDAADFVKQGDIYLVRNAETYPLRLKKFSDAFFHKIMASKPYPLEPENQGLSYLFPETRIQFLTLNSCWQIDQFNRKRAAVHPEAVGRAIEQADAEVAAAVERGDLKRNQPPLRLAVWHHAVAGPELIQDTSFISNLRKAGVRACLHGDVHEMRAELIGYKSAGGGVHVIGAGSFASPAEGRPEATPRLYNVLEIQPDLSSIRVHTREQRKPDGAWQGWHEWPDPEGGRGRVPYYQLDLT